MIFIIDDDRIMADCIAAVCNKQPVKIFSNAIDAITALDDDLPDLIFLDILLDGPDGFTFLNEIASYEDSMKIPVVIVSSLELGHQELESYGVVGVLNKDTMTPDKIKSYLQESLHV